MLFLRSVWRNGSLPFLKINACCKSNLISHSQLPVLVNCFHKHNMTSCSKTYQEVLDFWFDKNADSSAKFKLWFGGGPEQDQLIKDSFGELVVKARNGDLSDYEDLKCGLHGGMAFIILIDQFCRNIYRGTPDMFSHDHKSLAVALKIIDSGRYKELSAGERFFLYLPLEHTENKDIQVKCVELYTELLEHDEGLGKSGLTYALQHQEVINQFGRFPRRNAVLGRANTPEEEIFLRDSKYTF